MQDLLATSADDANDTAKGFLQLFGRNFSGSPFSGKSIVDQAEQLNPTLTLVWIGCNDIMESVDTGMTVAPLTATEFKAKLEEILLDIASASSTRFAVANLPNLTDIQLFKEGYPASQTQGTVYGDDDGTVTALQPLSEAVIQSGWMAYMFGQGQSESSPLADELWVSQAEAATLQARITAYNAAIQDLATAYGFPVIDINSFLADVMDGGATVYGTDFDNTTVFSTDKLHISPKGQAAIANKFIEAVNSYYKSSIELVDVSTIE